MDAKKITYELIVVDHSSTDKTAMIAELEGAHVIDGKTDTTIATIRVGVMRRGKSYFLSTLTSPFSEEWPKNINSVAT